MGLSATCQAAACANWLDLPSTKLSKVNERFRLLMCLAGLLALSELTAGLPAPLFVGARATPAASAILLAGFAGLLHSSMIWQANPRDFMGLELDVLAAVVLGGASIFGGRGSVIGTMIGVFTLVMVKNSLILMKIDTTWQRVVVGAILILATAITAWRDRKKLV